MTTPTPSAQDGERERLISELDQSSNDLAFSYRGAMRRSAAMLRADATQSAELAALRAQVEKVRSVWKTYDDSGETLHDLFDLKNGMNAALAPPQPVAKETKP